ncbi:tyrosine-type recombinase/integrase [Actinoplanes philippinensis]|uniref:tyrosine-type recombinase/integrase n=1 Tax=Actinoplanes philippinensis TaxID=35752 RepID=UPI0033E80933
MGLPESVVQLLRDHRDAQHLERQTARQLWQEGGWVFASPMGLPLNPNTDYHEWKRLLQVAGVRDGRLHDARHTAATVLMLLGVQERAAMDIMGWATTGMAARYQHVTDPVRADIAKRVGGLIWQTNPSHVRTVENAAVLGKQPVRFTRSRQWRRLKRI